MSQLPSRLYKYLPPVPDQAATEYEWHRERIVEAKVHFAAPSALNDPWEFKPFWVQDLSHECVERYVSTPPSTLQSLGPNGDAQRSRETKARLLNGSLIEDSFATRIAEWGALCLSESCDSLPMWTLYGGGHRGYCVEYDFAKLQMAADEIHDVIPPWQVKYTSERVRFSMSEWLTWLGEQRGALAAGASTSQARDWLRRVLYTKSDQWREEREWRMIAWNRQSRGRTVRLPSDALARIIFGARVDSRTRDELQKWNAERGHGKQLRLGQMRLSDEHFACDVIDLA